MSDKVGVFKNSLFFSIVFFTLLVIDIYVKESYTNLSYRYVTQPLVLLACLFYYIKNFKGTKRNFWLIVGALVFFIVGRIFVLHDSVKISILFGMLFFTVAKALYGIRFFNQNEFNISNIIVLITCCFGYLVVLLLIVYDHLEELFIPVIIYLFITFLLLLFALLRRKEVVFKSFLLVFFGVISLAVSEWLAIIDIFYLSSFVQSVLVTLLYGLAHYLVVLGLIEESKSFGLQNS